MAPTTLLAGPDDAVGRAAFIDRARSMVPYLRENAAQTEVKRCVSAQTFEMLRDAELFRILQPARFGGFETDFNLLMDLVAEIGRGCGSSAWVYGLGAVHQWLIALFPDQAQHDVWGDDPNSIVTGSYAPSATAAAVPGGYRISGSWQFVSGVDHSKWSMAGVMFAPEGDQTVPTPGLLLVPATDYTVDDTWHTYGLCGTGSKTIVLDDVFVPAHRKLTFAQAASGNSPGSAVNTNPLYKISFLAALPTAIASPAFGAVQGAIDDFLDLVRTRTTRGAAAGAGNRMAEFAAVQSRVAEAMACLDAARLLIARDNAEVMAAVSRGESISVDTRIRNRRDHAFSVRLTVQAADALNECTGGLGLYLDNTVQRAWRDVHAVAKHITLNWDAVSTMVGQHAFGLTPKGAY